jgi:hypothetical protein
MSVKTILAKALGMPEDSTDEQLATKLADVIAPQVPVLPAVPEDPQGTFHSLAKRLSEAKGISLGDAYSLVSREAPDYYSRVRDAADLNRVML